jgi:2-polyprenyl-3-methyl-5-hydroxy-6-metoxy-1,4-benzoquinol methylase
LHDYQLYLIASGSSAKFGAVCAETTHVVSLPGRPTVVRSVITAKGPDPVSREAYDKLASSYSARAPTKPHNAYYERPATLSLLGDVRGGRVLDAACGPGIYAELLADRAE